MPERDEGAAAYPRSHVRTTSPGTGRDRPDVPERGVGQSHGHMLTLEEMERHLQGEFPDLAADIAYGELTLFADASSVVDVLTFCRDDEDLAFDLLSDLSGVHWPGGDSHVDPQISTTGWPAHRISGEHGSIEVTYHLVSTIRHHRLRIVVALPDENPRVPSVVDVYPTADFHEREVFDFFGVRFEGHPNLVRILMPEDWVGHPLRKDYPLGGVDTDYAGAHVPPPDRRVWAKDVPTGPGPEDEPKTAAPGPDHPRSTGTGSGRVDT